MKKEGNKNLGHEGNFSPFKTDQLVWNSWEEN